METKIAGILNLYGFSQADKVYSTEGICPTILAYKQGQIGHQIQIIEESESLMFPTSTEKGFVDGYEGDSVGITFMKGGHVHNPVSHGISRTITTFCDHDIGVITEDERKR